MFEIILKSIIFIAVLVVAILYYRKHKNEKYNILRVLFAVVLLTMVLSYLIPGKNYSSYTGKLESGYAPISISDMFLNGITAMNVSLVTIAYLFAVSLFYVVLKKTNKYEVIVNNVAATFKKNKSLFIVLTVFVLGLTSLFTGQLFIMIVFIPFLISVIRKLGYSKEIAITTAGKVHKISTQNAVPAVAKYATATNAKTIYKVLLSIPFPKKNINFSPSLICFKPILHLF